MPSDKAIEAAREAYTGKQHTDGTNPHQWWLAALTAAYAVDGDFNAGVEAAAKFLDEMRMDLRWVATEIRKLKR